MWFGQPLRDADVRLLLKRPNVYFNKYSGTEYLCRKKVLCTNINRMKSLFPDDFNFVPTEFNFPEEKEELEGYIKAHPNEWMIAKPSRGCGGDGIFLFRNKFISPVLKNEFVIQKYISKPLLVENKKFDMRLYAIIKNLDPVEAYFCNEGLVRFCTEDYIEPNDENASKLFMHLTNYSLNKDNEKYINPEDFGEDNKGTKRLLSHFFNFLVKEETIDFDYVKEQLVTTVRKTIICLVPYLKVWAKKYFKQELNQIK